MHPLPDEPWFKNAEHAKPPFISTVQGKGIVRLNPDSNVEFDGRINEIKWLRVRYGLSLMAAKDLVDTVISRRAQLVKEKVRMLCQDLSLPKHDMAKVLAELSNEAIQGF